MRKRFVVVLVFAVLALGLLPFLSSVQRALPNSLYAVIFGGPPVKLDIDKLLASGAGLRVTYRSIWLKSFAASAPETGLDRTKHLCAAADPAGGCDFRSLQAAFAHLQDGDVLVMGPGIYQEAAVLSANGVTIRAEPGARIQDRAAEGKGALVIKGDDTVIEGLECSGISVPDRNGACIRLEGHNLTLKGVYFHDSEEGLLSGKNSGLIVVEDSLFERLGAGGRAHGLYIGAGPDSALILRRTHILATKGEGHGVKSRAASTFIENCTIASLGAKDSRLIDLPVGGKNVIRGNVLENGPNSSNTDVIGIGLELSAEPMDAATNRSSVTGNIIILDRAQNEILHARHVPAVEFVSNAIVGGSQSAVRDGNYWFRNRGMAGLPEFPALLD
jgi:hypothetical protein